MLLSSSWGFVLILLILQGGASGIERPDEEVQRQEQASKILKFFDEHVVITPGRRLLVEKNIDEELMEAIMLGDVSGILLSAAQGADPNNIYETRNFQSTPLIMGVFSGNPEVVQAVLDSGANPGQVTPGSGFTPLDWAVHRNLPQVVKVLIDAGASVDQVSGGITNLHYASIKGFLGIVRILLDAGAGIESRTEKTGATPLIVATQNGNLEVVRELVRRGANVHARNCFGGTALHYAALHNLVLIIDLLVQNKAQVDAQDGQGLTPLHLASFQGHGDSIRKLLRHKASRHLVSKAGKSAKDFVCECLWDVVGTFEGVECNEACNHPSRIARMLAGS